MPFSGSSHSSSSRTRSRLPFQFLAVIAFIFTFLVAGVLCTPNVQAQVSVTAAPAGTSIGNQASATYTDGSDVQRTATSNTVTTIVQQVAAVEIVDDSTQVAGPGSPVYFAHTVTNLGNGADSFALAVVDNDIDFAIAPVIYADADANGIPDNNIPITNTSTLASGATFSFVVQGTVPPTATAGQSNTLTVTATSTFDNTVSDSNTDTVNVTNNAAIAIAKSIDDNSGPSPSGPYTYTLTYTNSGNSAATALTIIDQIPSGMQYVADSGAWSLSPTPLTDTNGANDDPAGIDYSFANTGNGILTIVVASVPAQTTGRITFQVNVRSGVQPGVITNIANFEYNDGANDQTGSSNPNVFTVAQQGGVTFTGPAQATPIASQGSSVNFVNTLVNTGTGTDVFNIVVNEDTDTFPANTTFQLFQSDGSTPLLDSDNDGILDTGPVEVGATYLVVLRANLPPGVSGGGPYTVTKTATSKFDPTQTATATDTLTTIAANTVDLTNAGGTGAGAGPEANPVTTVSGNPGTIATFELNVPNTSGIPDSYVLQFSSTAVFNPAEPLPLGWTVTFRDAGNTVVTGTGTLAAGATRTLYADVFIPAGSAPGNVEVYFRAVSPTSGAADIKHDRVSVNTVEAISAEPNNSGQVYAGNSVVYSHTVTNTGNVTLNDILVSTANTGAGFTAVAYLDADNDGVLDPEETVTPLTNILALTAGQTVNVFVKVFAPAGAAPGTVNVTTLTTGVDGGPRDTATDTTTVITGDLRLFKEQAIDPDGDGAAVLGAFGTTTQSAAPGAIIRYRITVTNTGAGPVNSVVVNDTTPAYTVYDNGTNALSALGQAAWTIDGTTFTAASSAPADGAAGPLAFTIGTLGAGQSATVTFGVKIRE